MSQQHSNTKKRSFQRLTPYQRGQIQALIEQRIPKYVIQKVQDWINRLRRRLLGYHTPEELFKEQIARLSSAT